MGLAPGAPGRQGVGEPGQVGGGVLGEQPGRRARHVAVQRIGGDLPAHFGDLERGGRHVERVTALGDPEQRPRETGEDDGAVGHVLTRHRQPLEGGYGVGRGRVADLAQEEGEQHRVRGQERLDLVGPQQREPRRAPRGAELRADPAVGGALEVAHLRLGVRLLLRLARAEVVQHGGLRPAGQVEVGQRLRQVRLGTPRAVEHPVQAPENSRAPGRPAERVKSMPLAPWWMPDMTERSTVGPVASKASDW